MRFLITYLQLHRERLTAAGMLAAVALILAAIAALWRADGAGLTLLGDIHAPPPATAAPPALQVAYESAPAEGEGIEVARAVTAGLAPSAAQQQTLFAALSCVREQRGQAPLVLDTGLSEGAASLWGALMRDPEADIAALIGGRYPYVSVVPITLAADRPDVTAAPACGTYATDVEALDLGDATTVGIAVFVDPEPGDGLDDSSAVIVAR